MIILAILFWGYLSPLNAMEEKEISIASLPSPLKSILKTSSSAQRSVPQVYFNEQILVQDYDKNLEPIDINEHRTVIDRLAYPDINPDALLTLMQHKLVKAIENGIDWDKLDLFVQKVPEEELTLPIICVILKDFFDSEIQNGLTFELQHKQNLLTFLSKFLSIKYDDFKNESFVREIDLINDLIDQLIITFVHIKTLNNYKLKNECWKAKLKSALDEDDMVLCQSILNNNCYDRVGGEANLKTRLMIKEKIYKNTLNELKRTIWYRFTP